MTIFEAWLLEFNEKMKKENRHVLLLIDNAGGHNISLELRNKLTNVEVSNLPANTTSVLQPLDQGIIRTFKLYYRKLLVEYLLDLNDNEKEYTILLVNIKANKFHCIWFD
jgi:serine/threonine protein phosphatase PrpC